MDFRLCPVFGDDFSFGSLVPVSLQNINMRDDFTRRTKEKLEARAGHKCSNPDCRAPTSGPQITPENSINVGIAAHISAAAPGGPRYNAEFTPAERQSIRNGIWLCQICAKLIDSDLAKYTIECLMQWKVLAEAEASAKIGKPRPRKQSLRDVEREVKRGLKMRNKMRTDFLKPAHERSVDLIKHPFERFQHDEVIVHDLARNDEYPSLSKGSGISSWLKFELFDFYANGLLVIIRLSRGIIGADGRWAILDHDEEFDDSLFEEIKIWELGNIPFRNIRHYELDGDNHYDMPHLYCAYADGGTPYEAFSYAIAPGNSYDYLLRNDRQIKRAKSAG